MQDFGIDDEAVARLNCEYSRLRGFSSAVSLELRKKSVGFMVQVRVQAGCHTTIHITDALSLKGQLSEYEIITLPYMRAAPLRRNLRAISFITHLTIPHQTYQ